MVTRLQDPRNPVEAIRMIKDKISSRGTYSLDWLLIPYWAQYLAHSRALYPKEKRE